MSEIGEKELRQQIKSADFQKAYLIYGEESYLKEYYISQIRKKTIAETFEDFNLHFFDGKGFSLDDALKDAQMLPMMGEYNLVIVRDYSAEKSKQDIKMLEDYLADCPDTTIFILWYDSLEPDVKSANFKKIVKLFAKAGAAANLQKRSESDVARLLVSGAKKRGAVLSADNARYFISVSGNDMKTLLNELDKLANFADGGEITKQIIDDMATKCLQARIYDLSKHIISGNSDMAYSVLDTLFLMKEEPIIILSAISGVYVDMYRVKCAKAAGFSYDDISKHYNYRGREFALRNASRDSAKLTDTQLRESLDEIAQTDIKLKSTAVDKRLLLEELIVRLIMKGQV